METNGHRSVIQLSDQYFCRWCSKTWDANDPYPPECSDEHIAPNGYTGTKKGRRMSIASKPQNLPWPTPMAKAFYVARQGVGFVVWADGAKDAADFAVMTGLRPTYMRALDVTNRVPSAKVPRAEINPLTLTYIRRNNPDIGAIITPVQYLKLQKGQKK